MRAFPILIIWLLAGCAGVSSHDEYRAPRTQQELTEHSQHAERIHRAMAPVYRAADDFCSPQRIGCFVTIGINVAPGIGAFAALKDGRDAYVFVTFPTMRFLANDAEVALVIAHEQSHILLGHNGQGRALTDVRRMEYEADCLAAAMLARAGYDVRLAADAYRRLQARPEGVVHTVFTTPLGLATHPTWGDRYRNLLRAADSFRGAIDRDTIVRVCGVGP